jgi:glucose-fructose oxidoreductase
MSNGTIINFPLKGQQPKQLDEDCMALMNNSDLIVPGEEGMRDIRIVEATRKAASFGQRVRL